MSNRFCIGISVSSCTAPRAQSHSTLPALTSSADGMSPRRRSSDAFITTGSFCMLCIIELVSGTVPSERSRGLDPPRHGDDLRALGVVSYEFQLVGVSRDDHVVEFVVHTNVAELLTLCSS